MFEKIGYPSRQLDNLELSIGYNSESKYGNGRGFHAYVETGTIAK